MGPFLTFIVLELQRGYLYQNGVEFRQKVIGAGLNLFLGHLHFSSGGLRTFPSDPLTVCQKWHLSSTKWKYGILFFCIWQWSFLIPKTCLAWYYCHTRPNLKFQLSWQSGKSKLASWATKWHYNQTDFFSTCSCGCGCCCARFCMRTGAMKERCYGSEILCASMTDH